MKKILYTIVLSLASLFQFSTIQAQSCNLCDFTIINMIDCVVDIELTTTYTDPITGVASTVILSPVSNPNYYANGRQVLRAGTASIPASHNFSDFVIPLGSCADYVVTSVAITEISLGTCPPFGTPVVLTPGGGITSIAGGGNACCCNLGYTINFTSNCTLLLSMNCPS